ncbi:MAG: hypothetical protein Q7S48_00995 [bacterium]|nr:hypothetical protein [bacterium]
MPAIHSKHSAQAERARIEFRQLAERESEAEQKQRSDGWVGATVVFAWIDGTAFADAPS